MSADWFLSVHLELGIAELRDKAFQVPHGPLSMFLIWHMHLIAHCQVVDRRKCAIWDVLELLCNVSLNCMHSISDAELIPSCSFEDVRKVWSTFSFFTFVALLKQDLCLSLFQAEIDFFLEHWNDIRSSASMATVWQQIRDGRHPGFEEGMRSHFIYSTI